jgi:hypothetical protein
MGAFFDAATDFWALRAAALRASRGVSRSAGCAAFLCELEREVLQLQRELREGRYEPGPFHTFPIRDPKPRVISAAPFRDRVVHHALCAAMEPVFEAEADFDSYACRTGKGTLAAVRRVQEHARRWPWYAKLDVLHCFETADLSLLGAMLAARFDDPPLLAVLDRVLTRGANAPGIGLPIGNLTSQHLANLLLGAVDREARRLGVGGWVRYMDDLFVFGADKASVKGQADALAGFVSTHMGQAEKPSTRPQPRPRGVSLRENAQSPSEGRGVCGTDCSVRGAAEAPHRTAGRQPGLSHARRSDQRSRAPRAMPR